MLTCPTLLREWHDARLLLLLLLRDAARGRMALLPMTTFVVVIANIAVAFVKPSSSTMWCGRCARVVAWWTVDR